MKPAFDVFITYLLSLRSKLFIYNKIEELSQRIVDYAYKVLITEVEYLIF